MSKKGQDLKAFLNKNKKKNTVTKTEEQSEVASVPDASAKPEAGAKKVDEVKKTVEKTTQNKGMAAKKDESSDEEVDDDLDQDVQYGNIKEAKAVVEEKDDNKADGFGYDQSIITRNTGQAKQAQPKVEKPKTGGEISFGSRPTFSKGGKKTGLLNDFKEGLDDLDDDGKKKQKGKDEKKSRADDGQREFLYLGSSARVRNPDEEQKTAPRPEAVKPKFTGKLNLTKTGDGADKDKEGATKNTIYDFSVKFSGQPEQREEERKEGGAMANGPKKFKGKAERMGMSINEFNNQKRSEEPEEGFEVVTGIKRSTRKRQTDSDE